MTNIGITLVMSIRKRYFAGQTDMNIECRFVRPAKVRSQQSRPLTSRNGALLLGLGGSN